MRKCFGNFKEVLYNCIVNFIFLKNKCENVFFMSDLRFLEIGVF